MEEMSFYYGRQLAAFQAAKEGAAVSESECVPALLFSATQVFCNRCGSRYRKKQVRYPSGGFYCPECLAFGRLTETVSLWRCPQPPGAKRAVKLQWDGILTPSQAAISQALQTDFIQARSALVWAVTGAGKTEITYACLQTALAAGCRVAFVSPRIDVCRELIRRLRPVFPNEELLLLTGSSSETYRFTAFLVATTHQLLKFYQAFDLIILDEVDAFPYVNSQFLAYGLAQALKPAGVKILLTATPTKELLRQTKKELALYRLPGRFHRRALPVPQLHWYPHFKRDLKRQKLAAPIVQLIRGILETTALLFFCSDVASCQQVAALLQKILPAKRVAAVHAAALDREQLVAAMYRQDIDILVCTTMLERGVTFAELSVIVASAEHRVFTKATLVQIAGRVDRKGTQRTGEVHFLLADKTAAIRQAVREIKGNNRLAEKQGLLE